MASNLATSKCPKCEYHVRLADIRGKPLEIRRSGPYAPHFGVRFDCRCGEIYFVIFHRSDGYWSRESLRSGDYKNPVIQLPNGTMPNREAGRFVHEFADGHVENTGTFTLDLSYYSSFRDEPWNDWKSGDPPGRLCEDNAEDVEWVWE